MSKRGEGLRGANPNAPAGYDKGHLLKRLTRIEP
jgi:hypothetical protein